MVSGKFVFFNSRAAGQNFDLAKKFAEYLNAVLDFTAAEIKAGKTKQGFLKNTTFPGIGEWKGDGDICKT